MPYKKGRRSTHATVPADKINYAYIIEGNFP